MPAVSIIIPNYNHARFLRRRIDSVLQQTFQDFEVILLDDCSTDDSKSLLNEYAGDPRVRIEFNSLNSGSTFKQWNKGVRLARGQYVWFAESDDYAGHRMLERLMALLEANPRTSFAYCRSWRVLDDERADGFADPEIADIDLLRWTSDYIADGSEECRRFLVIRNTVPNASAVVFRKSVYEGVGGADERMRLCGDWKVWSSMALAGQVAYLAEPLNYFRYHAQTVRHKSHILAAEESLQVVQWILDRVTIEDSESLRNNIAELWLQGLVGTRVPLRRGWTILRQARRIDPHALRRFACAWAVHDLMPVLKVTRSIRHALGLDQRGLRRLRSKV